MAPQNDFVDIFATRFLSTDITNANHLLFNHRQATIQCVSTEMFQLVALTPDAQPLLISAAIVRLYADYNIALATGSVMPTMVPVYYTDFAAFMNEHDASGFGWAYIHDADRTIAWTDALVVACPEAYYVRNHEISEAYLPPGPDENRQNCYHKERMSLKRLRQNGHTVGSKESMEQFVRRHQALHDAAERATAAAAAAEAAAADNAAAVAALAKANSPTNAIAGSSKGPDEMEE
ncbi:hypothetical protein B0H17DRAFT_1193769 [Mycena rosella]|uniref:Uncharacterized protein n=1 Tax=Mycena rosella TaxID=1033263 RepID=A0AAD7GT02_MYCRO|nr:hypothetical protein B0H17DRAFT_1193769 [Mycena rosella]